MKIACLGGGPGGLYFAISAKCRNPEHEIDVYERNRPDDTFGWGVVFSDQTLENLRSNDPVSAERIFDAFHHWDDIDIHFKGECVRTTGHGFAGLSRKKILLLLQQRARELGVRLHFETEINGVSDAGECDLIVACDGLNSKVRGALAEHFRARHRPPAQQVHLARHPQGLRRVHLHLHRDAGGLRPGPRLPLRRRYQHVHRRCAPSKTWRALGIDQMSKAESNRFLREASSLTTSTATS